MRGVGCGIMCVVGCGIMFGMRVSVALALGMAACVLSASIGSADASYYREGKRSAKEQAVRLPKGPIQVIVSIGKQRLTLYANGVPVARSTVSTGTRSFPTPRGVFTVLQKRRVHHSNIYDGAPMPYMQRLTWSGVALHAGVVPGYPASHGCIRLPAGFARLLWGATRIGTRVVIARDDPAPVEIAHPRLPAPNQQELVAGITEVKTAGVTVGTSDAPSAGRPKADKLKGTPNAAPVSLFISRKEGKLFVRQHGEPLFETPVTIADKERPLGTHVFTATEFKDGVTRWIVVSMPGEEPRLGLRDTRDRATDRRSRRPEATPVAAPVLSPRAALDRIEMPPDAIERLLELLTPGASLIVSDHGMSHETGKGTDFIVLTPEGGASGR
jgi:L,D-transpeptidase catalytic domain